LKNILKGIDAMQLERGVYVNGQTAAIRTSVQQQLEAGSRRRAVRRLVHDRPTLHELQQRGVLPAATTTVSPLLVSRVLSLNKSLRTIVLNNRLQRRMSYSDVRAQGLVPGSDEHHKTSPRLIPAILELERQFQGRALRRKIQNRPSANDMERAKLLDARACASLVCPGVRPKIRQFERVAAAKRTNKV
jgi:hypothetical protein